MKRTLLALIVGTFMLSSSNVSAQAFEEGNVGIDLYYGFPNLYTTVLRTTYANGGSASGVDVGGIGPLGLRVEYMLADKVGLGLDVAYSSSSVTYTEEDFFDPTTSYDYKVSSAKIGAMVTFNYHFIDNDQVDFYGMVGAGWRNRSYKFTSTDPSYIDESIDGLIPVSFRMGIGVRYFFTDNIGLNLAAGFGQGGILNGGVSFKF
jgi:opacity protein-like surface antigen